MIVSDFTRPELEHFRTYCNFVGNELKVFEMRSQGVPLEEISELLNMSIDCTRRTSQKVNRKITRIMGLKEREV